MSKSKDRVCVTRLIKNTKYVQHIAPHLIKKTNKGISGIISEKTLAKLHTISDLHKVIKNKELVRLLKKNKPGPMRAIARDSLFRGTLYFVRITFNTPRGTFSINNADMRTAINYSKLAVIPISLYASQYGYNRVDVSNNVISYSVNLQDETYTDAQLIGWIADIVARNNIQIDSSCLVILNPALQGITNMYAPYSGMWNVGGYHSYGGNIPYCFCNVFGQNLTIDDRRNYYAQVLSHEIAEMVVDPRADQMNPEVCDVCACNCENFWLDFFSINRQFIKGFQTVPPPFDYVFFINSIAKPASINPRTGCGISSMNPQSICVYPPPLPLIPTQNFAAMIDILFGIINDGGGIYRSPDGKFHIVPPLGSEDPEVFIGDAVRETERILAGISALGSALRVADKKERKKIWKQAIYSLQESIEELSTLEF